MFSFDIMPNANLDIAGFLSRWLYRAFLLANGFLEHACSGYPCFGVF